jgi:tRNA (guanine-N7-)-methyltransferase
LSPARRGGGAGDGPSEDKRWYGRRVGRKLRPGRRSALEAALPRLRAAVAGEDTPVDPRELFGGDIQSLWMEIGFGAGEHLAAQAAGHPETGFIGCEPFVNGVAALIGRIDADGLANVRIFDDDVRLLLPRLPDAAFARIYVLFPDPWPKTRHHRRRMTVPDNLAQFARLLADDGLLVFASDQHDFAAWTLANALARPELEWCARRAADWRNAPSDWVDTRYQEKARDKGLAPVFLLFRRRRRA